MAPSERLTETVARRLRGRLAEMRISGAELGRRTGIKQSTVSRRLTGAQPFDLDELELICGVLGITLAELLTGMRPPVGGGPDGGVRARRDSNPQPSDPKMAGRVLDGRERFEQRRGQRSTTRQPLRPTGLLIYIVRRHAHLVSQIVDVA